MKRGAVRDDDHVDGPAGAPLTLMEYGDFECPHCFRAHPIVKQVRARLGGTLRFAFRNFPLTQVHPHALDAAMAAESVSASRGAAAYWTMHDLIFTHQQDSPDALDRPHLARYATTAGADGESVVADIAAGTFEERVARDFSTGVRSGVNGTPTFFINGRRFDGDWSRPDVFLSALERAMEPGAAPA
jgi:protein-disulfide isomerase